MSIPVDYSRHSGDYATHRPGFPASFYERLDRLVPIDGTTVLDLGTGPGVVACALAERGATVTGVDVSADQVEQARRRAADLGFEERCAFHVSRTEDFDPERGGFDLVIAGQCWWWFDEAAALAMVRRALAPGGHFVVASFDYLPRLDDVGRETERLILGYNPGWPLADRDGTHPEWMANLPAPDLPLVEQFCYDERIPFTHEAWRGRIRTCNGVGSGALTPAEVEAFDRDLASRLRAIHPEEPMAILHRIYAVVMRSASDEPA